jgi:uncharacterized protein GlcG (DUF336 family)
MQQQRTIDYADAQKALTVIVAELQRRNAIGVIAVADNHGELIAFARMDGAPFQSITIAINKAFTAARAGKPTREIGKKIRSADQGFDISFSCEKVSRLTRQRCSGDLNSQVFIACMQQTKIYENLVHVRNRVRH